MMVANMLFPQVLLICNWYNISGNKLRGESPNFFWGEKNKQKLRITISRGYLTWLIQYQSVHPRRNNIRINSNLKRFELLHTLVLQFIPSMFHLFLSQRPPVDFIIGQKVEAVDKRNPLLVRVATIADIEDYKVKVSLQNSNSLRLAIESFCYLVSLFLYILFPTNKYSWKKKTVINCLFFLFMKGPIWAYNIDLAFCAVFNNVALLSVYLTYHSVLKYLHTPGL